VARLDDRRSGGGGRWWLGQLLRSTAELVDGVSWQRCLTPACYAAAGVEASGGNARGKVELSSMPPAWDSTTPEGGGGEGRTGEEIGWGGEWRARAELLCLFSMVTGQRKHRPTQPSGGRRKGLYQ
jgi:hypothetical protein